MLEFSRGSYTQYVANICILLICSISYWLCKEIRLIFCAACTVAMDMCITLCYKRTYTATIYVVYLMVI